MMEWLLIYALFAITTALTSIYELCMPVIQAKVAKSGKLDNKYIYYFTFFIVGVLMAPLVFFSCVVPSMGERFRDTLANNLFLED
jgi:uncharacterized membrane protein YcfT